MLISSISILKLIRFMVFIAGHFYDALKYALKCQITKFILFLSSFQNGFNLKIDYYFFTANKSHREFFLNCNIVKPFKNLNICNLCFQVTQFLIFNQKL